MNEYIYIFIRKELFICIIGMLGQTKRENKNDRQDKCV